MSVEKLAPKSENLKPAFKNLIYIKESTGLDEVLSLRLCSDFDDKSRDNLQFSEEQIKELLPQALRFLNQLKNKGLPVNYVVTSQNMIVQKAVLNGMKIYSLQSDGPEQLQINPTHLQRLSALRNNPNGQQSEIIAA